MNYELKKDLNSGGEGFRMYALKEIKRYDFISKIEKKILLVGKTYQENKEDKDDFPDFIKVPSQKNPDANCLAVMKAKTFLS